jgi:D-serine deaminase-like pyridoxal phosphate-dependent protein
LTLLPEVDIGQGRCGVTGTHDLIALVERIARYDRLRFGGLQAYHGGIQHVASWDQRRVAADIAAEKAAQYVAYLDALGIRCPVVTGGGTGTVEFDMRTGVYTELQPGSYVFMDAHYGSNEWHGNLRTRQSLYIASTIMSTAKAGMAVCDVGLKGVAVDSGLPRVKPGQYDDVLQYVAANDEHGMLQIAAGGLQERLGDQLLLVPGHCDPTANLYEQYVCFRGDRVEDIWEIDARGLSQ